MVSETAPDPQCQVWDTTRLGTAVLSITTLKAGTAFNIIPESVEMTGTFRCYDAKLRESLLASLQRTTEGVASALRCTARVRNEYLTPAVNNDPAATQIAREVAAEIVGEDRVTEWEPLTGSDDLAYLWQQIPGCYAFVGSGKADGSPSSANHNAKFDIDESALAIGADLLARAARRVLQGNWP